LLVFTCDEREQKVKRGARLGAIVDLDATLRPRSAAVFRNRSARSAPPDAGI